MDKETVNINLINSLLAKGYKLSEIDGQLLIDFADILYEQSKLFGVVRQSEQLKCADCKYSKSETYHDRMWCRDCQQYNHFKAL